VFLNQLPEAPLQAWFQIRRWNIQSIHTEP
jgi:hypothetical protein